MGLFAAFPCRFVGGLARLFVRSYGLAEQTLPALVLENMLAWPGARVGCDSKNTALAIRLRLVSHLDGSSCAGRIRNKLATPSLTARL